MDDRYTGIGRLDDYPDIMNPHDVMDALDIGRSKFYELVNSGELKARKIGKKGWRVTKENLLRFVVEETG